MSSRPHRALRAAAGFLLPVLAGAQSASDPTDDELRLAWRSLPKEARVEAVEFFRLECSLLSDNFQKQLVDHVLATQERDPGLWPDLDPLPHFDPQVHAPGQPIPRRYLDYLDPAVIQVKQIMDPSARDRLLRPIFVYDWGTGELRRRAHLVDNPEAIFQNAMQGFLPSLPLAQEQCERLLDDGRERELLAAFAHAYTDRKGGIYPGVTLYDAWASEADKEMPDVDNLGIVHELLDDWKSWIAPVPGTQHDEFYDTVEELFVRAQRYRGLREALARAYLRGSAVPGDAYRANLVVLNAIWESVSSTPSALVGELPGAEDRDDYVEGWHKRLEEDSELEATARKRIAWLDASRDEVRGVLVRVLRELGAFDPPPPPPPLPSGGGEGGGSGEQLILLPPELAHPADDPDPLAEYEPGIKRFLKLSEADRRALLGKLDAAVRELDAPQVQLVLALVGDSAAELPAPTEFEAHDPEVWGGGKRRRKAREGSSRWKKIARQLETDDPPRGLEAMVTYEWGTGRIVRREPEKKERGYELRNLLRGYPLGQDHAEALLQQRLDGDGPLREQAEFFSHPYADLSAYWYEGIALYDVWSRQIPNEVPDVDVLAYAVKIRGETLTPPLKGPDHQTWYPRIHDDAVALMKRRRVAEALSAVWLEAEPALPLGYSVASNYLHALLATTSEELAPVRERFDAGPQDFLERVLAEMNATDGAYDRGNARQEALRRGAEAIRAKTLEVLAAEGLL
jgi:hypothetical protein